MTPAFNSGLRFKVTGAVVVLCAIYLSFAGLDHTLFWDDEALVAIHARNYLQTGTWTAWTGRNLAAYGNGMLLDDQLETRDPKVQHWLAILSFKGLGVSTWTGRFPFVLVGLAGLGVFVLILRREFPGQNAVKLYALTLLALSPVFLLNIRQCRYYAPCLTFGLLTYYFYRRCSAGRSRADIFGLALAAALLFYSQYLVGGAFLVAIAVMHLVCHRRECARPGWINLGLAAALFLLATVPFLLTHPVWIRAEAPVDEAWYLRKPTLFWWYVRDLNAAACLPWTVTLMLIGILWWQRKHPLVRQVARPWTILGLTFLAVLSSLSFQSTRLPDLAWTRYLIPVVPFLAGLTGIVLGFIAQRSRGAALALLAILLGSNLLSLSPWNTTFRWLLPAYIQEVHRPFRTPYQAAVEFIRAHVSRDALVAVEPEFCAYPLMFYLDDHVRFGCLLNTNTLLPRAALERLSAPLWVEEYYPDWLMAFGSSMRTAALALHFCRVHHEKGREVAYSYRLEKNLEVFWFDTSRPELAFHTFGPRKDFDPGLDSVYAFRRLPAQEVYPAAAPPAPHKSE